MSAIEGRDGFNRMPKEADPLSSQNVSLVKRWIEQGAVADDEPIAEDPRQHWSFLIPKRPSIPGHQQSSRSDQSWDLLERTPVDSFIGARLAEKQLVSVGQASKDVLIRRISLDLTGLPPSPVEIEEYVADMSPDSYERIVDRLLASPRFGERWGRHWMDVWRYSDWYGYAAELRNSQRHIWRWRDWIVESLNSGKSYDQMIIEMLAADEVSPTDVNALRATGFLARNYYVFNRDKWLDETVEHTSKAFFGLTMNCARCHHHMFDPISQQSYYELRAVFEPYQVRVDRIKGQADIMIDGLARIFDKDLSVATYLYERGNDKRPVKDKPIPPGIPEFLTGKSLDIQTVSLPPEVRFPGLQSFIQEESIATAKRSIDKFEMALKTSREKFQMALAALEKISDVPADASEPFGPAP
ncbi:MAG: DUF1549 domain-containing protein, partial [Planctomycetes bacterium]|nr:DUF1549 domain-containing protein [Planctomycetota bacterium]